MRIRLVFDEGRLLTKEQQSSGLRRCWFLIKPEIATVADLASELFRRFKLQRHCPDGIFFSMDDFVLPPFESTSFFRENDIISVHKRACKKKKKITSGDDVQPIDIGETVEREDVSGRNRMLAIESCERIEMRNSQVIREGNSSIQMHLSEMGSKRKHKEIEKPESSKKKKKQKLMAIEKPLDNGSSYKESQEAPNQQSLQRASTSNQILHEEANLSDVNEASPVAGAANDHAGVSNKTNQAVPERNGELEENCNAITSEPNSSVLTKKLPSRSARRKYAKRQLKKLSKKQAAENMQSEVLLNETKEQAKENHVVSTHEPTVTHDFVVARVDRPGHIRFESEGEDDEHCDEGPSNMQSTETLVESFQWNGITNKTKGQKWGQEKNRYSANGYNSTFVQWSNGTNKDSSTTEKVTEKSTPDEEKTDTVQVNFENLSPLIRSPKVGDLIAYRVVELSSTWCPDLSPFRVGEVKVYDLVSNNIILVPVPGYPMLSDRKEAIACEGEEDAPFLADSSLYEEDGSLEIEFSSLVDVRLLRGNDSVSAVQNDPDESMLDPTATEPDSNWEANGEVANPGNTQAEQNSCEKRAPSTSTPSWSYKALRVNAVGPIIEYLRKNEANTTNENGNAIGGCGKGRDVDGGRSSGGGGSGGRSRGGRRRR